MPHTPGPWRIGDTQGEGYCPYISADLEANRKMPWNNHVICQLYEAKGEPYDYRTVDTAFQNSKDNARLIAAAPELLEALKEAFGILSRSPNGSIESVRFQKAINDLIAKAEGK